MYFTTAMIVRIRDFMSGNLTNFNTPPANLHTTVVVVDVLLHTVIG